MSRATTHLGFGTRVYVRELVGRRHVFACSSYGQLRIVAPSIFALLDRLVFRGLSGSACTQDLPTHWEVFSVHTQQRASPTSSLAVLLLPRVRLCLGMYELLGRYRYTIASGIPPWSTSSVARGPGHNWDVCSSLACTPLRRAFRYALVSFSACRLAALVWLNLLDEACSNSMQLLTPCL